MNVLRFDERVPEPWASALSEFERQFLYPLGPDRRFRISHGDDYLAFFRAMGPAVCFVAENGGAVAGTVAAALRRLRLADGAEIPAAYLGDLKVRPHSRGTAAVPRLLESAQAWVRERATAAYAVVMEGTAAPPAVYTGRAGIEALSPVGQLAVLRLSRGSTHAASSSPAVSEEEGRACFERLALGRLRAEGASPAIRSRRPSRWLALADGSACGLLEDTRRAKTLWLETGAELESAHLSRFAYASIESAAALLREAAAAGDAPALFACAAAGDAAPLESLFPSGGLACARASIFAAHIAPDQRWIIDTAEI